jgi:hypothetical protein
MTLAIDVSPVVGLRRRIADTQFSIKVAAVLSAVMLGTYSSRWFGWIGIVVVPFVVGWAGWRLAHHFRQGNFTWIRLLTLAYMPYAGLCLSVLAGFFTKRNSHLINYIVVALYVLAAYKIPLGLVAAFRIRRSVSREAALLRLVGIWQRPSTIHQPGIFQAKGRLRLYAYLMLVPLPTFLWLLITFGVPAERVGVPVTWGNVSGQLGENFG